MLKAIVMLIGIVLDIIVSAVNKLANMILAFILITIFAITACLILVAQFVR